MFKYLCLQWVIWWSKQVNKLLKCLSGYSLHSGRLEDKRQANSDRTKCVHIRDVWWRAQFSEVSPAATNHFLLSHNSYTNLDYLHKKNVYLYFLQHDKAFFIEVDQDFDVYDSENGAFVYHVMYKRAKKIISVSIENFLIFAEELGKPKANLVLLSNTGRCGSTLLTQMMEGVPNTVVISEPFFMMAFSGPGSDKLAELHGDSVDEILAAGFKVQCKPTCRANVEHVIIKTHSMAVKYAPAIARQLPQVRHVFMYRGPRKNILSYYAMVGAIPTYVARLFMGDAMKGFLTMLTPEESGKEALIQDLNRDIIGNDFLTMRMFAAFWCIHILNYQEYQAKGKVDFHPIGYEDLLASPEDEIKRLLLHCKMPVNDISKCIEAMSKDSQKGSILSKDNLKKTRKDVISEEDLVKINAVMDQFGFPDIDNYTDLFQS